MTVLYRWLNVCPCVVSAHPSLSERKYSCGAEADAQVREWPRILRSPKALCRLWPTHTRSAQNNQKGLTASAHSPLESLITPHHKWAAWTDTHTRTEKQHTHSGACFNYKRQMLDDSIAPGSHSSRPALVHYHVPNITDIEYFWAKPSPQITTHQITLSYDNLLHIQIHTQHYICNFSPELYFMLLKH